MGPERARRPQRAGQQRGHDPAGAGGGDHGRGLARGHRAEPDGAVLPRPGVRARPAPRRRAREHRQRRLDELLPRRHGGAGLHRVQARPARDHARAGERVDRARDPGQRHRPRLDGDRPDRRPPGGPGAGRGAAGPVADRALGRARPTSRAPSSIWRRTRRATSRAASSPWTAATWPVERPPPVDARGAAGDRRRGTPGAGGRVAALVQRHRGRRGAGGAHRAARRRGGRPRRGDRLLRRGPHLRRAGRRARARGGGAAQPGLAPAHLGGGRGRHRHPRLRRRQRQPRDGGRGARAGDVERGARDRGARRARTSTAWWSAWARSAS